MIEWLVSTALLGAAGFTQNCAFVWWSRSCNSGDPEHHRYAAWVSNGVEFATGLLVWHQVWSAMGDQAWWRLAVAGLVYVVCTSEGSVLTMRTMLRREVGKRRVGAYDKEDKR